MHCATIACCWPGGASPGIPKDLMEAALIDGAGEFAIFMKIVIPLCTPVVATLVIFTFILFVRPKPRCAAHMR